VFLPGPGEDENIIQVHQNELANVGLVQIIHDLLEGGRRIGKAKAQHLELKMANRCAEGRLGYVLLRVVKPLLNRLWASNQTLTND
jgi:hypothetical protein